MKRFNVVLCIVVSGVLLAACETQDAYTGKKKINRATKYGAIGAVVCGALGSRKNSEQAQKAALVCGLAGVGIGAYMDAQERKLRAELVNSGVQVKREGNNLRLVMPNNITFQVSRAELNSSIYSTLNSVVKVLNEYNETLLQVAGHTDSTGSETYNQQLSVRRASGVANYLRSRNVEPSRLIVVGYGESRPIATNNTEAGRAENRRVELLIEPNA